MAPEWAEPQSLEQQPDPPTPDGVPPRFEALRLTVVSRLPDWAAVRVDRMSTGALAGWATALVAVIAAVVLGMHHHGAPSYSSYDAPTTQGSSDASAAGSSIVVDVAGRVRRPGLVTLPIGARVADAVKAAGGARRQRDLAGVDLAQRVADGELITVGPRRGHGSSGTGSRLVSLSTASLAKLETLPGVGPVTAQKIIAWRRVHGGFSSVSQLQQVSGIGPARFAELSPLVAP
jgi:competence protein ComEA